MGEKESKVNQSSWLEKFGLHRTELRAWAMYDWANSAFATSILAAILPIYYQKVAAASLSVNLRTVYWGYTQTVALVIIALASPLLGAAADHLGAKKRFLAFFAAMGALGTGLLCFVGRGEWKFASAVFIVGNIGFAGGNVFYESLLPHIAKREELDRVSAAGYALGYVGGGLLLALQLVVIMAPQRFGLADSGQASRLAFVSVAVWWLLFAIPLMLRVKEPEPEEQSSSTNLIKASFGRLANTYRDIRRYRQVFVFLIAFWFFNDGINTIIRMAAIYGAEIGIGQNHLIGALLLVQFLGIPCTFAYAWLAGQRGAKTGIYIALAIYVVISVGAYFISTPTHFWILACAVGLVQGGSQALSRSLFATMVPRNKSSEFFGFYCISGKFGNIMGPFVFSLVSHMTGSRLGVLSLIFFFVGGMVILSQVDVEAGQQAAMMEDAR